MMIEQSAFPVIPPLHGDSNAAGYPFPDQGMSLRDYFAAKAMQGMCTGDIFPDSVTRAEIAKRAWAMADDMMKARQP